MGRMDFTMMHVRVFGLWLQDACRYHLVKKILPTRDAWGRGWPRLTRALHSKPSGMWTWGFGWLLLPQIFGKKESMLVASSCLEYIVAMP